MRQIVVIILVVELVFQIFLLLNRKGIPRQLACCRQQDGHGRIVCPGNVAASLQQTQVSEASLVGIIYLEVHKTPGNVFAQTLNGFFALYHLRDISKK